MEPTLKIYSPTGAELAEVLITPRAVHEEELMKSNFIRLSWDSASKVRFMAGAYIYYNSIKWRLLEPYEPEQKNESKFSYEPEFHHPVQWMSKIPMYQLYGDVSTWETATKSTDWVFTGPAKDIISAVIQYIIQWGENEDLSFGEEFGNLWTAQISNTIADMIITVSVNSNDILTVCDKIAQQCDCEYVFDFTNKILRFGETGDDILFPPVTLKAGVNVSAARVSPTHQEFYNRYIVHGGTQNMSQPTQSGYEKVTERLCLNETIYPDSIIDVRADASEPMMTGELIFDEIYPKLQLYIYGVRERRCYKEKESGGYSTEQYSKWYIRLAYRVTVPEAGKTPVKEEIDGGTTYYWYDYLATDDKLIPDTELQVSFLPNPDGGNVLQQLCGRTFDVHFFEHDTSEGGEDNVGGQPFPVYAGDYRIEFVEENGVIIPTTSDQSLYPHTVQDNTPDIRNNLVTLIGIIVTNELKSQAQTELAAEALKEIQKKQRDLNAYTFNSYSDRFHLDSITLVLGQNVTFNDGQDLNGGTSYVLNTRVRRMVTRLDNPNLVEITVGNEARKSQRAALQEQIETILSAGASGGSSVNDQQVRHLIQVYGQQLFLSKIASDVASGKITFQQGLESVGTAVMSGNIQSRDFMSGLMTGRGWQIDNLGNGEFESLRVRSLLEVVELLINRMQAQEGDTIFSDNDQIEDVEEYYDEAQGITYYTLTLKEKWDGYITAQQYGNILKGIVNTLAAKEAGVSDVTPGQAGTESDGKNSYYTSWMRVIATHDEDPDLGNNQIRVILYGDNQVPSQKNFEPCKMMNIARWGCVDYIYTKAELDEMLHPSDGSAPKITQEEYNEHMRGIASVQKRQVLIHISTSEGRIVKMRGVNKPILEKWNYGTTLGTLPDWVKEDPEVSPRIIEGRDYLYAQGIVVQDWVKVDINGQPLTTIVDMGDWQDNTVYLHEEYNSVSLQWETHDVFHNGVKWRCMEHQPVVSGGTTTYYEPKWNSPYWMMLEGNTNLGVEFSSSRGYSFRRGYVNTVVTPYFFYGNLDISADIAAEFWNWTRCEERNMDKPVSERYTPQDEAWNAQHRAVRAITLTDNDMPVGWSSANKAVFTCTVTLNDGKTTRYINNYISA